jgi:small-conductance mechanosensitive channel
MEEDSLNQTETVIDSLQNQVEFFLAMISRPVVQRQILAFIVILIISWLLPEGIRRWRKKRRSTNEEPATETISRLQRWLATLYHLLTPTMALVLLNITITLFAHLSYPSGLLQNLTNLVWIWLIYRTILTLLYARYGIEGVRPYRNRIITPLFIFLLILQILATVPGSVTLAEAAINLGVISFTLGSLLSALIVLYLFNLTAWIVEQVMIRSLPSRLNAEPGVIESVATLTRYTLVALGLIIFLGMLGLDFTSLAIIAGGLSVGIGIGLQDIVANFVSGLVLLFEQSLRPGDVIELDGRISEVEKISLRATTVRTLTNEELIVPNNNFTTNQVKNFTKSERLVQIVILFGVSYKSDPELVREIAIETSLSHHLVLVDPPPTLLFIGYGDSSLDFELRVSVNQPELTLNIRSDLYYMLWDRLAENDIEIPYPQRDLNFKDGWEKFASDLATS